MGLEGFPGPGGGAFQEGVGRKGECEGSWGSPGVESQQLGVHEHKGMQGLLASPPGAGVDGLDDVPLQRLDAQLTELRVDQPLHGLGMQAGVGAMSPQFLLSQPKSSDTFTRATVSACHVPEAWEHRGSDQHRLCP